MTGASYYLETEQGQIQVTKGTYLTHLKKNRSTLKTLKTVKKTKNIARLESNQNIRLSMMKTVKKNLYSSVGCTGKKKNLMNKLKTQSISFIPGVKVLFEDSQVYNGMPQLIIPMDIDNDCESQWHDIQSNIQNMSMSLRLASYDSFYR